VVSRPLAVAIGAMILLVASVTFEVVFEREITLEVRGPLGFQDITEGTSASGEFRSTPKPGLTRATDPVVAAPNDTIEFRVRVDNGFPWAYDEPYDVRFQGVIVAEGEIQAGARDRGESSFTIPASTFFSAGTTDPSLDVIPIYIDVQIGSEYASGSFHLKEAS